VGFAHSDFEARQILSTVFDGSAAEAAIAVELASVHIGRSSVLAYWRTEARASQLPVLRL
jgi:hypothetical protein